MARTKTIDGAIIAPPPRDEPLNLDDWTLHETPLDGIHACGGCFTVLRPGGPMYRHREKASYYCQPGCRIAEVMGGKTKDERKAQAAAFSSLIDSQYGTPDPLDAPRQKLGPVKQRLELREVIAIVEQAIADGRTAHMSAARCGLDIEEAHRQHDEVRATYRLNAEGRNETEREAHVIRAMSKDQVIQAARQRLGGLRAEQARHQADGEAARRRARFYTALVSATGELVTSEAYI